MKTKRSVPSCARLSPAERLLMNTSRYQFAYTRNGERWSQEHVITLGLVLTPRAVGARHALHRVLKSWFESFSPDPGPAPSGERRAVSGGVGITWADDCSQDAGARDREVLTLISGGEDGIESISWMYEELIDLLDQAKLELDVHVNEVWNKP